MPHEQDIRLRVVGWVESPLLDPTEAPLQGDEGAPDSVVVIRPELEPAMAGLAAGDRLIVVTWLHLADRDTLAVHPRDDSARARRGVFGTRSQDRPNPIGIHPVRVLAVDGNRIRVADLEAVDGTPVLDIKPILGPLPHR